VYLLIYLFKPNFCAYELKDKVLNLLHLTPQAQMGKKSSDGSRGKGNLGGF
jgi:hypothetical protein